MSASITVVSKNTEFVQIFDDGLFTVEECFESYPTEQDAYDKMHRFHEVLCQRIHDAGGDVEELPMYTDREFFTVEERPITQYQVINADGTEADIYDTRAEAEAAIKTLH